MELKWESFAEENFKYKWSGQYGTTSYALDIQVSRPCLARAGIFIILNYSMFVTLIPWKFIS
jgi:hypothetical protein